VRVKLNYCRLGELGVTFVYRSTGCSTEIKYTIAHGEYSPHKNKPNARACSAAVCTLLEQMAAY